MIADGPHGTREKYTAIGYGDWGVESVSSDAPSCFPVVLSGWRCSANISGANRASLVGAKRRPVLHRSSTTVVLEH